jgi:ComF family protein
MRPELPPAIQTWLEAALGFFYPEVCQHCGQQRALRNDGYVCAACRETIRWIAPPFCERCGLPFAGDLTTEFECANCREMELHFEHARSAVAARGVVLDVIHRYKYQRALWFEPFLAGLLVSRAAPALRGEGWDVIVPVPLHPLKQAEREFNQAERLAKHLGRATGLPVNARLVQRVTPTRTQTQLTRAERAANVRHAFALNGSAANLRGRRVVLVDDVLTTGATTSACARVLRAGGAPAVCVWTVARGLLH